MGKAGPATTRKNDWLAVLAIVVAGLAAFWPVLIGGFSLWDDPDTIEVLRPPTWAGLADRWTSAPMNIYMPLTHAAWHALAWLGGASADRSASPVPFKIASVVVHLTTSLVVLSIARRAVGRGWPALAAALLFCVHPLQVESVAWTSGLKDLLCGLFAATCVRIYLDGGDHPTPARTLAALGTMTLAMLAKPSAMCLPIWLLAIDLLWLGRPARASIVRLAPFAAIALVCAAIARAAQPPTPFDDGVGLAMRPFVVGFAYAFYLWKGVAPVGLAFDYGFTPAAIADETAVWFAWLAPVAVALVALRLARRWPLIAIGLLLAAVPIAPVSGLVYFDFARVSVVADHYAYLAMIGVAIAAAAALSAVRRRASARAIVAIIVVVWIGLSMRQSTTWRDAETVARRTIAVNPQSFTSYDHLGALAVRAGDLAAAEQLERIALKIRPTHYAALMSLGEIALRQNDAATAVDSFRRATRVAPRDPEAWQQLARAYVRNGEPARAMDAVARAASIDRAGAAARIAAIRATTRRAAEPERKP